MSRFDEFSFFPREMKLLIIWLTLSQFSLFIYFLANDYSHKDDVFGVRETILIVPLVIITTFYIVTIFRDFEIPSRQGNKIKHLNDSRASLRINRDGIFSIYHAKLFLTEFEFAYKSLSHFYETTGLGADREFIESFQHGLSIDKVVFKSPGFWEFIGKLNPLETIRQLMIDMHEREKDLNYRNEMDKQKLEIENKLLETKLIKERIEILKEAGISQEVIQEFLLENVINPLYKANGIDTNSIGKDLLDESENKRLLE